MCSPHHVRRLKYNRMKFRCISVQNVHELVPPWAINPLSLAKHLDELFSTERGQELCPASEDVYRGLGFWIEVDATASPPTTRVCTPDNQVNLNGRLIITCTSPANDYAQIDLPLNPIFKGYAQVKGTYSVYLHSFQTDTPLGYVGMTKQRWFDRYSQHLSAARTGSPLLFHQAIRKHQNATILHKVFMCELDHERALEYEEEWVGMFGLYPLGLNMIPGGKAGFVYLAKLGLEARTSEDRDEIIESLSGRESIEGRPNPLCAARWEADSNFVERVICGHSGRLTVQQIEQVRIGARLGKSPALLVRELGFGSVRQVRNVFRGKTYRRIRTDT